MTLYEIDQAIMDLADPETGEISNFDALDSLQMERGQKIEGVVCWVKNLLSDADAIKSEKEALAEREAKCRKKAEGLKLWLENALSGHKFSTAKCAVSFRKSEQVQIIDESALPPDYVTIAVTTKPDKAAIKKAIQSGADVAGASLVEKRNIQIK